MPFYWILALFACGQSGVVDVRLLDFIAHHAAGDALFRSIDFAVIAIDRVYISRSSMAMRALSAETLPPDRQTRLQHMRSNVVRSR